MDRPNMIYFLSHHYSIDYLIKLTDDELIKLYESLWDN